MEKLKPSDTSLQEDDATLCNSLLCRLKSLEGMLLKVKENIKVCKSLGTEARMAAGAVNESIKRRKE